MYPARVIRIVVGADEMWVVFEKDVDREEIEVAISSVELLPATGGVSSGVSFGPGASTDYSTGGAGAGAGAGVNAASRTDMRRGSNKPRIVDVIQRRIVSSKLEYHVHREEEAAADYTWMTVPELRLYAKQTGGTVDGRTVDALIKDCDDKTSGTLHALLMPSMVWCEALVVFV